MSMSTSVTGFKPANEKWKKMKAIFDACEGANIEPPEEVWKFFNHQSPDTAGVEIQLEGTVCCKTYKAEMKNGFEIDISVLPEDVKIIRFWNSY